MHHRHSGHFRLRRDLCGGLRPSSLDRGRLGFESDPGRDDRSHAPGGRPFVGSSHRACGVEDYRSADEGSARDGVEDDLLGRFHVRYHVLRGQNQIARRQREES